MRCSYNTVHTFQKQLFKTKFTNRENELLEMCCITFCFNGVGRGNVITTKTGKKNV